LSTLSPWHEHLDDNQTSSIRSWSKLGTTEDTLRTAEHAHQNAVRNAHWWLISPSRDVSGHLTGKLTGAALFAASEWSVWLAVISLEGSPNLCISCLRVDRRSRCGAEQRSACSDLGCATTNAAHLHAVNRSREPLDDAANRPAS
jgi:hypothetical protein